MKALEIMDLHVKYVLDDEVIRALNGINLSIEKILPCRRRTTKSCRWN